MPSSYKRLGDYIIKIDIRNTQLKVSKLSGLSMNKEFRETTSNIVGTDMSVYKVMTKNQFACDFMSPIRVNKLPVVLKLDDEPNLVSPAYPVFEIINHNKLLPQYLMMWFRRPEFDRFVSFKCDAAIRGGFGWEELCDILIPIPSIEKQREIVKKYNIVQQRIELNNQLIQRLEETAQALYKHWFVDFEFPNKEGKPYKSSGGKMVHNEELEKEIPEGWKVGLLEHICDVKHGFAFKGDYFSETETGLILVSPGNFKLEGGFNFTKNKYYNHTYSENYVLAKGDLVVNMTDLSKDGDTLGNPALVPSFDFKIFLHNQRVGKFEFYNDLNTLYVYMSMTQKVYKQYILGTATGTTVRHTSPDRIRKYKLVIPPQSNISKFNTNVKILIDAENKYLEMNYNLCNLKDLLLSRLAKEN